MCIAISPIHGKIILTKLAQMEGFFENHFYA
jgi:hypothetical protein